MVRRKSYRNFSLAMADVYKKHVVDCPGAQCTCHVRDAIVGYANSSPNKRAALLGRDWHKELIVGYRTAATLIEQGWPEDTIVAFTNRQQKYADAAMDTMQGFVKVLSVAGYRNDGKFTREGNGLRHAWLADGAPSLQMAIDELDDI